MVFDFIDPKGIAYFTPKMLKSAFKSVGAGLELSKKDYAVVFSASRDRKDAIDRCEIEDFEVHSILLTDRSHPCGPSRPLLRAARVSE